MKFLNRFLFILVLFLKSECYINDIGFQSIGFWEFGDNLKDSSDYDNNASVD